MNSSGSNNSTNFGKGASIDFDGIYLQSKEHKNPGKIKFISNGLGWKESISGVVITIKAEEILSMTWSRVARDYLLQIVMKTQEVIYAFDGFSRDVLISFLIFITRRMTKLGILYVKIILGCILSKRIIALRDGIGESYPSKV